MKFLQPIQSGFAAAELTKLSRQAGDRYQDIIWASREAERRSSVRSMLWCQFGAGNDPRIHRPASRWNSIIRGVSCVYGETMTDKPNEMIERVARAIFSGCTPFEGVGCCNDPDFDRCKECAGLVRVTARAAIEAMREPTEAMKLAAVESLTPYTDNPLKLAVICLEAAFAAALK